jgi:hypothetical protein
VDKDAPQIKSAECAFAPEHARQILARLVDRFLPFYSKLSEPEYKVLVQFKYAGQSTQTSVNNWGYNSVINKFLSEDTINLNISELLGNKDMYMMLHNVQKMIDPKYEEMGQFLMLKPNAERDYIRDIVNSELVGNINILSALYSKPNIPRLVEGDVVYKGLRRCFIEDKVVGDIVLFKNFMYVSIDNITSKMYSQSYKGGKRQLGCMCKIVGLAGVPFIHIFNKLPREYAKLVDSIENDVRILDVNSKFELVLPRNMKFRIVDIGEISLMHKEKIKEYTLEYVEQLPMEKYPEWEPPDKIAFKGLSLY